MSVEDTMSSQKPADPMRSPAVLLWKFVGATLEDTVGTLGLQALFDNWWWLPQRMG
jgi:hypothetical protein